MASKSLHVEYQGRVEDDDGEPELISKVYDEISNCFNQELSEPFLGSEEDEEDLASNKISCAKCVSHIRVERVSQIHKGLHIAMPGKRFHGYDPWERKQTWAYMHHAIVTDVLASNDADYTIQVKLIHMWSREDEKLGLCGTKITFDLNVDELYILSYKHPRYMPHQIVKRAEQAYQETENARTESRKIRFRDYNLLTTNCEHFATWCIVGKNDKHKETSWWETLGQPIIDMDDSVQVMEMKACIVELFGSGSFVAKSLIKLLVRSSDEIAKFVNASLPDASCVLKGTASVYLLYCLVMTTYYHAKESRKEMCKSCYHGYIVDLWAKCPAYMISVSTSFMTGGTVCISAVLSCFLLVVLSHFSTDIRKTLMSPYACEKKAVYELDDLNVGDIVTLSYWCLPHVAMVTEIHTGEERGKGKIRVVHYALDRLFSMREVREEYFEMELGTSKLFRPILQRHECDHLDLFRPETAVIRARQRIGEKKWHATTNRSDHVCYWAKVKPCAVEEDKGFSDSVKGQGQSQYMSTLFIGECDVHLSSDFEVGDALKVRGSQGIVVEKDCGERKMKLQLITVESTVKQLKYFIDLNTERVSVLRYHPGHCHPKSVRADRAKLIRDQAITIKTFMDFCILKK